MEAFINEIYDEFYIWVHIVYCLFLVLLVGGSFCISFFAKPVLFEIKIPNLRYSQTIALMQRFVYFAFVSLAIISTSGIFIAMGQNLHNGNPADNVIFHSMEGIWVIMMGIFIYIYIKLKEASKHLKNHEYIQSHENLELITRYLLVFNTFLGIVLIYFNILLGNNQC